jgi:hypothetical protein
MYGPERLAQSAVQPPRPAAQEIADAFWPTQAASRASRTASTTRRLCAAKDSRAGRARTVFDDLADTKLLNLNVNLSPECCLQPKNASSARRNVYGSLRLPGDKSISHRYGMLAALPKALRALPTSPPGPIAPRRWPAWKRWARRCAAGRRLGGGHRRGRPRDAGRAPARLRQLRLDDAHDLRPAGAAAGQLYAGGRRVALAPAHGAHSQAAGSHGRALTLTEGHAPLTIEGGALKAIDYTTPVPSAQVKTCILLAGLQTAGNDHGARGGPHPRPQRTGPAGLRRKLTRTWIRSRFRAAGCTPSTPPFPATSLRPHSFSARRRSFPAPAWCSIRSA